MRTPWRRCLVGLIATFLAAVPAIALVGPAGPAAADPAMARVAPAEADPAQRDGLYQLVGVDQIPADYVLLVDASAAMRGAGQDLYGAVIQSVRALAATLGPRDQLRVITFADGATVEPGVPAQLPPGPAGSGRDIGAAIDQAVTQLARPDAAPVAAVVLFAAGRHAPPAGSPYPSASGPNWDALRVRAATLAQPTLYPFAVSLGPDTDAGLLGTVFPNTRSITAGPPEQVLDRARQSVLAAKARRLLGGETEHRVRVTWPPMGKLQPGVRSTTLTLRNDAHLVPLTVTRLDAAADDPRLRVSVPAGPFTLRPGESVNVPVTVDWSPGTRGFLPYDKVRAGGRVTLTAQVGSVYDAALRDDVGEDVHWALTGNVANAGGVVQLGRPRPWSVAMGAGLVLALVAVWVRRVRSRSRVGAAPTGTGVDPAREDLPVP
jgi:hypothetical protein